MYDSGVESELTKKIESMPQVKVYAKLPGWFKIDTPPSTFNPDWAVLFDKDGKEKLFFVQIQNSPLTKPGRTKR